MDDNRFDNLVRLVGGGASRRSILKGLLGLGGAAISGTVTIDQAHARTRDSRPTLPPPSPPDTTTTTSPPPTTTTTNPCSGYQCGLDCCENETQCCDGECCPGGYTCLTYAFAEGPLVQEETCCLTEQTCDNQCCAGTCFTPPGTAASGFDRSCCPAGANLCPGAFAGVALCCSGDTPDCCTASDGSPVCLTVEQCCTAEECAGLTDPIACQLGVCLDFTCEAQITCDAGASCCLFGDNFCCPGTQECCRREVGGVPPNLCIDPGQCCTDADCIEFPASFCNLITDTCDCTPQTCDDYAQLGLCGSALTTGCGSTIDCVCGTGEQCCPGAAGEPGVCRPDPGCCSVDDCDPPPDACTTVVCNPTTGACDSTGCPEDFDCCERTIDNVETAACIDPASQCCDDSDCQQFDFHSDCVACNAQFACVPAGEGESCDESDCRVCDAGSCVDAADNSDCEGSEFSGVCCEGFCLGGISSCDECSASGSTCETDDACCFERCCNDFCIAPDQCCGNDDCGNCLGCEDNECVLDCRTGDGCCLSDEFCNEANGQCEGCREATESCSGAACCDGLFCISSICQACVPLNNFGCGGGEDCCDDGSKFCSFEGRCRCGTPDLFNICSRDGDECCDQYSCVTTQEFDNPLRGLCTAGTCSASVGAPCPCCAGFFCASNGTCVNACNFSDEC